MIVRFQASTRVLAVLIGAALLACRADRRQASPTDTITARTPATDSSAVSPNEGVCGPRLWTAAIDTIRAVDVIRHAVNRGTSGMASQVKWVRSPDGCSLLVMQDPAAVEAEPVPNGFLMAHERGGRVFQRDSVWDAAPSPDWQRVAFAIAFGMQPRGAADSLTDNEWRRFAATVGVDVASVRRSAFSCSGMAYWFCVSRLHIAELPEARGSGVQGRDTVRALPTLAGWRVRWRVVDTTVLAGTGPRGSQDHNPPAQWLVVDPESGAIRDTLVAADTSSFAALEWTVGPTITYGAALDLASRSEVSIDGGVVRSDNGWIEVVWRSGNDERSFRVGAGRAVAATQGGRFIAAIVPRPTQRPEDWPYDVVVYQVGR